MFSRHCKHLLVVEYKLLSRINVRQCLQPSPLLADSVYIYIYTHKKVIPMRNHPSPRQAGEPGGPPSRAPPSAGGGQALCLYIYR